MGIDATHPAYDAAISDFVKLRDLAAGSDAVKNKGQTYLPATSGMKEDGMNTGQDGYEDFTAYKLRAVVPDYVNDGVTAITGILHQKSAVIELPSVLEPLLESATSDGVGLNMLLRLITIQQLIPGRIGLLLDLPLDATNGSLPFISLYQAETIRNWNDGSDGGEALSVVVLDETRSIMNDDLEWEEEERYRLLKLTPKNELTMSFSDINNVPGELVYSQALLDKDAEIGAITENQMVVPMIRGVPLNEIPFIFINSKDLFATPDKPPLLGLAEIVLTIYRGEADYRHNLFMQGQDTLVIKTNMRSPLTAGQDNANGEGTVRTGAGSKIEVEPEGDVKYVGVSPNGLAEQRQALEADRLRAEAKSGQSISTKKSQVESGETLKTRISSQTVTLPEIANTAATGLEKILKIAAEWVGANPDEVKVTPNLDFSHLKMEGKELLDMMTARSIGAPLSKESIHRTMLERDMTKLSFEEELEKINEEDGGD